MKNPWLFLLEVCVCMLYVCDIYHLYHLYHVAKFEPVIIHAIRLHGFIGGPREIESNSWDQIALGTNLMAEKTRA